MKHRRASARSVRFLAALAFITCLFSYHPLIAQSYWSVGPKFGYTFGNPGGFTFGVEASYFPNREDQVYNRYGFTLDLDFGPRNHFKVHSGIEGLLRNFFGLDIGPTLYFNGGKVDGGLSIIPFLGLVIYPFYEWDLHWDGAKNTSLVGGYVKFPIGLDFFQ